jgi:hypothetical protein
VVPLVAPIRRFALFGRGLLQESVEIAVRGQNQPGVLPDGVSVGLQRFHERVEIRIHAVRIAVDLRRLGVGLALDFLGAAICLGLYLFEVPFLRSADSGSTASPSDRYREAIRLRSEIIRS